MRLIYSSLYTICHVLWTFVHIQRPGNNGFKNNSKNIFYRSRKTDFITLKKKYRELSRNKKNAPFSTTQSLV